MSVTLGLMIGGTLLKGLGSLIGAGRQNQALQRENAYNQSMFNNSMQRMDIQEENVGLQRQQAQLSLDSDMNQMSRQRSQQVGGMTAMAAASGIVTGQSSMGAEIQDQDDQFLRALDERKEHGSIQMQGLDNSIRDMALQREGMRNTLDFKKDNNTQAGQDAWLSAGFDIAGSGMNLWSGGAQNNWWRT